jgi:hypothetical protein
MINQHEINSVEINEGGGFNPLLGLTVDQIICIPSENTTSFASREDRTNVITAEMRTNIVAGEDRSMVVYKGSRTSCR